MLHAYGWEFCEHSSDEGKKNLLAMSVFTQKKVTLTEDILFNFLQYY
jgi:hypothetical protein